MKITFLGTAAAERFPALWCRCASCHAARAGGGRDVRANASLLINDDLLIDAGPDVRSSAARLRLDLAPVQALLLTHPHYDHLDPLTFLGRDIWCSGTPLPLLHLYATPPGIRKLEQALPPLNKDLVALRTEAHEIAPFFSFEIRTGTSQPDPRYPWQGSPLPGDALPPLIPRRYRVWSFTACHGEPAMQAIFFAIQQSEGPEVSGNNPRTLLYATDTGPFPAETWTALMQLGKAVTFDAVVIDATLGTGHTGDSHMNIAQAGEHVEKLEKLGLLPPSAPRLAHHFSHYFTPPHAALTKTLEQRGMQAAFDGMSLVL
jgi:phosphoribosyl 1,2-cyclic phosphate phosphodiesterase